MKEQQIQRKNWKNDKKEGYKIGRTREASKRKYKKKKDNFFLI